MITHTRLSILTVHLSKSLKKKKNCLTQRLFRRQNLTFAGFHQRNETVNFQTPKVTLVIFLLVLIHCVNEVDRTVKLRVSWEH